MINLPLYKAETLETEELATGWLFKRWDKLFIRVDDKTSYQVNNENIFISLDNGNSWLRLKDLEVHTCTDFDLTYSDMKYRSKYINQPPNGSIFTIVTDKGR